MSDPKEVMTKYVELHATYLKNNKFRCDDHKDHIFLGSEVELRPFGKNFNIVTPFMEIKLVDENGKIIGTGNTPSLPQDVEYFTMHCPICHEVHLGGFYLAE